MIPYVRHQEASSPQKFAFRTIDAITANAQMEFFQERAQYYRKRNHPKEARVALKLLNHCDALLNTQHDPSAEFDYDRPKPGNEPDPSHRSRHKNFEGGLIIQASAYAAERLHTMFDASIDHWATRHAVAANITALSAHCRNLLRRIHQPVSPPHPRKDPLYGIVHQHDAFLGTHRLDQLRNQVMSDLHESTPVKFSPALNPYHRRLALDDKQRFEPESFAFLNDRSNYTDTYPRDLYPLLIYFHQGQKIVQVVDEPYPVGFPQQTAIQHLNGAIDEITLYAPYHDYVYQRAQTMLAAAMLGVHNIDIQAYHQFFNHLRKYDATSGDISYILTNIAYGHADVARLMASWMHVSTAYLPDKPQRRQVTEAARNAGMEPKYLYNLASILGNTGRDLALYAPSSNFDLKRRAVKCADQLNLPDDVISRIRRAI